MIDNKAKCTHLDGSGLVDSLIYIKEDVWVNSLKQESYPRIIWKSSDNWQHKSWTSSWFLCVQMCAFTITFPAYLSWIMSAMWTMWLLPRSYYIVLEAPPPISAIKLALTESTLHINHEHWLAKRWLLTHESWRYLARQLQVSFGLSPARTAVEVASLSMTSFDFSSLARKRLWSLQLLARMICAW